MIFKRLIEKINFSPNNGSQNCERRARQSEDYNAERNSRTSMITKRSSHNDLNNFTSPRTILNIRSASSGNALYTSGNSQYSRSKSHNDNVDSVDFENTTSTDSTSSTENVKVCQLLTSTHSLTSHELYL